jgi:hypothetical protein
MKKLSLSILLALIATLFVNAQDQTRTREIGLYTGTIKDLSNMGLRFKFGTEKSMFRITFVSLNYNGYKSDDNSAKSTNLGGGVKFGIEKPITLNDRFNFYYGPQLGGSYAVSKASTTNSEAKNSDAEVSLGCIAGLTFKLVDKIYLSLEIVPSLSYLSSKSDDSTTSIVQFNNYNNAGLIIGFRF